ncbi:MAG TPA: hypothetical protein VGB52_08565 [Actinomycetota bacterium]
MARFRSAGLLLGILIMLAPLGAHADPIQVGSDETGDFGMNDPDLDPILAEIGPELGFDLVSASIEAAGDNVNFIIGVSKLPENGGAPEIARYTWNVKVDGADLELDGKYTNYSRGACDPTAGTCPPPRDPGEGPFAVRGDCVTTGTVTLCQELALVHATFDPSNGTITIPVPLELLGGCSVAPGTNLFGEGGESISVAPSAFFTYGAFPMDLMFVSETVSVC